MLLVRLTYISIIEVYEITLINLQMLKLIIIVYLFLIIVIAITIMVYSFNYSIITNIPS